jgi:hypothetical protein
MLNPDESPGFLRYLPNVQKRMAVFVDDTALTWPTDKRSTEKLHTGPA